MAPDRYANDGLSALYHHDGCGCKRGYPGEKTNILRESRTKRRQSLKILQFCWEWMSGVESKIKHGKEVTVVFHS